jgi:hypothetical protein
MFKTIEEISALQISKQLRCRFSLIESAWMCLHVIVQIATKVVFSDKHPIRSVRYSKTAMQQ